MLECNIPFDKYIDYGATVLHVSAAFGRNDIILWLYTNKFNFERIDKVGFYALQYAAANRHVSTVLLLNVIGCTNTYRDGMTPLLNIFKLLKAVDKEFDLCIFLEELHISVETLLNATKLITLEKQAYLDNIFKESVKNKI